MVNGENAAGGVGITPKTADEIFGMGVDVITLGNHTYRHAAIYEYLDARPRDRAADQLPAQPAGARLVRGEERDGSRLGVVNVSGRIYFVEAGRPAFAEVDAALHALEEKADHVLVDVHAEATSEKIGMGWCPWMGASPPSWGPIRTFRPPTPASSRAGPPTSPTSG